MPDILGIDHIYIAVGDIKRSTLFYDALMPILGFKKSPFMLNKEEHVQYYNRHFGYVLRPARRDLAHDPYAPGLHHLCMRVQGLAELEHIAHELKQHSIEYNGPTPYPQYAPDYFALFLSDPDGIELEITNYRQERRERHEHWA